MKQTDFRDVPDALWGAYRPLLAPFNGFEEHTRSRGGEEVRECWRNPARRGVVERTFVWLVRWRRLVRDYERRLDVSESMIQIAMASILLKRFIIDK